MDSDAVEGSILFSNSCFRFSNIDGLTSDTIKAEHALLLKKNKEQLKKDARELNVKVNCQVNGASHDAPKEVIRSGKAVGEKNSTALSLISS